MYKKYTAYFYWYDYALIKYFVMTKFTVLIILLMSSQVNANVFAQRININAKSLTLKEIVSKISKQSGYHFLYLEKDLKPNDRVTLRLENVSLQQALDKVLSDNGLHYTIRSNRIIIEEVKVADVKFVAEQRLEQQRTIKGHVVDSKGNKLVGVTVTLRNGLATSTNGDGAFEIVAKANDVIQFDLIGFEPQVLTVGETNNYTVTMSEKIGDLDEVVVVGYGTQKKASVVGAVQTIKVDDLRVPSSNLSTGFAGRLAGVVAVQRSGEPGADGADFWIRGISTFSGMTSPLIVIDGVQASSGDLNALDPEVIESFSILKDATATALYGTRGANGVMIVTTKSGRDLDKPIINGRFETSYTSPIKVPHFVNGVNYMKMYNEAISTRKTGEILYPIDKIDGTSRGLDPYAFPDVDWYNELFRKGATTQNLNFSVRGGGKKMDYFSNVSYNREAGMLRDVKDFSYDNNLKINRYVLQNNINVHLTPTTRATVKVNAQLRDYHGPQMRATDIFGLIMEANPVDFPMRYPNDPEYSYIKWGGRSGGAYNNGFRNPYAEMVRGYSDNFQSTVTGQIELNQKLDFLTKGMSASALFSFKNWSSTNTSRSGGYNQFEIAKYIWNPEGTALDQYTLRRVGAERVTTLNTNNSSTGDRQIYVQGMLNYDRTFGQYHNITGMLLYNQEEYNVNSPSGLIQSLPKRKQGIAGRATYGYDNRYLGELNFGYNGTENFAKGHRFGFFPSVGLGYVISQESYFKNLVQTITNLKIRGSWGLVGNDQISGDRYLYLSDIALENGDLGYTTGRDQNISKNGPKYFRFANPNITWEIGEKINLGLDLSIKNSFNVTVDFFRETRRDIFMERRSIPEFVGISPKDKWIDLTTKVYGNLGKVKNKGFDLSLDYAKQLSDSFSASFKGTFTYAKNVILEYDEPSFSRYPNLSRVGHSTSTPLLYIAERLFIDDAEVENSPTQNIGGFIRAGDIKYRNIADVTGMYDDIIDANDRRYVGSPEIPEIVYGFGPSFRYKKFDFSFFLQGVANTSIVMSGFHPFGTDGTRNVLEFIADDYWSEGQNPDIYAKYPRLSKMDNRNNTVASTYWLRDGAFLKLKNAEIGFNHRMFRIYLRGSNLLTFSKFKYWDPEQGGGNGLRYPTQRVANIGIQVNFNK
ncbi:TonB-dependent receptor [Sphingobacterium lumbrici]|uniref:TonB-dependent receptor n=1 Tax=Sphingobacterium lumbrici TaxID=2559600 RepID=UPI001125E2BD|nr:TonB-dependent receptor [Sphingobacterium lumbrici]